MRIALFTECYRPIVNGVVVSVITFAQELRKQGHDVHIVAPAYPGYRDTEPDVYRLASISFPSTPRYPLVLPYASGRLRRLFASRPPDVIHAQHPFLSGSEARRWARRLGRPLVYTYHTLLREYVHYVPLPRPIAQAAAVRISRGFCNSADSVVVPTRGVERILRDYGVRTPIDVIPTGVDLTLIRTAPQAGVRQSLGIPEGAPLVAYSGRIALEKNLETLIRAFAVGGGEGAHLVFVGGGPWEEPCHRLAGEMGIGERFHITGYLERHRVFGWLSDADIYCFPSLTDTQGVAILEAMAAGCAAVAVRSGAIEDVIRPGRDGLVVEPTVEALAAGLAGLVGDEGMRKRLAGQARSRAEEFSADRMARRLVQVYEKLLGPTLDGRCDAMNSLG